ncbi:MAG: hypothetical protein A2V67_06215 [Deltaproteobacteria bacterium RBG_13_61_14]|nr:MAG: hypothetical protein A2V67_06215 [Deltaproteobacteria bacterium RBG_13_61_14]
MVKGQSEERGVKGTMVLDIVKTIHGFKDVPWDRHLSPQAMALVSKKILASTWYPEKPVKECFNAIYRVLGGGKPEAAREWGRVNGRRVFEDVYKNLIVPGDPMQSLKKLNIIANAFFKGWTYQFQELGTRSIQLKVLDSDRETEVIYYLIQGWIDVIIEITGGKNARVLIPQKHWEGNESTIIDIRWE